MSYFANFPLIEYKFEGSKKPIQFTNLLAYSRVFNNIGDDQTLYRLETVIDGERPDILSNRLYGSPEYYWSFYLLNEKIQSKGWPLSTQNLIKRMKKDIPGECLVFLPQESVDRGNDTNWLQHEMIEEFKIGDKAYGLISGACGTIYDRNVNLGQIFVDLDEGSSSFIPNEVIVDSLSNPNSQLTVRIVHSPAYEAIHHFEDGDGDHIDVDYALDFRGRGSELISENVEHLPDEAGPGPDGNYVGGVVGSLQFPNAYDSSRYNQVTFREFYENENDDLSRIRIIRPGLMNRFAKLFKESIEN